MKKHIKPALPACFTCSMCAEWLGHPGCWFVSQLRCVGFVPMGSSCENSDLQGGCSSWLWRLRDWEESPKCWFKCIRLEAIASRLEAIAARLEAIAVRLEDNAIGFLKLFLRFLLRVMVQVWTPELPLPRLEVATPVHLLRDLLLATGGGRIPCCHEHPSE